MTRISFKKHMKRGAHLLAPGPAGVKGRFVREIMLLLDRTKHKRERGFTLVMSVTKLSSLCKCLARTKFSSTVASGTVPARVVSRSSAPATTSTIYCVGI